MAKTYYSSMIILIVKSTNLLGTSPNLKYLYRGKHFNHSQLNINIEKHQMYIYCTFSNHCPLDRVLELFSPNQTNSTKSCFNLPSLLQYMIHSFSLSYHHFVHRVLLYILMLNSYHIYCFSSFLPILICIFFPLSFLFSFLSILCSSRRHATDAKIRAIQSSCYAGDYYISFPVSHLIPYTHFRKKFTLKISNILT